MINDDDTWISKMVYESGQSATIDASNNRPRQDGLERLMSLHSSNSNNEALTAKAREKAMQQKIDLLEEEKAHGIAQQKKWQSNYFALKDEYDKLLVAFQQAKAKLEKYANVQDDVLRTMAEERRQENKNVESNNRARS